MPLTCIQAAKVAKVSVRRIQILASQGRIPDATRHGSSWLIPDKFTIAAPPVRKTRKLAKIKR